MKIKFLIIAFLISFLLSAQPQLPGLMPYPKSVTTQDGKYRLNASFNASCIADDKDDILYASVNRIFQGINRKTSLYFKQQYIKPGKEEKTSLKIKVAKKSEMYRGVDESYSLQVNADGILLEAPNSIGAIRGLETLQQLLEKDNEGFYIPFVQINDAPRYSWRGLMIDVARHFIPIDVIKRNIDAMATVKMNVLHLHLTDDEGFRIESKLFPKLHEKGSNGQYFTQDQIKDIVAYSRLRGIMVVPEFDLPGHTRAWFAAFPEFASAPGPYEPGPRFNVGLNNDGTINMGAIMSAPSPTLDPTREEVYKFMDKLFGEMASLFPSQYVHIGADENNGIAWKNNPAIVSYMKQKGIKDVHELQAYFVKRMYGILQKHKKTMVGWEELNTPDLPKDVVVQKWIPDGGFMKSHGKPLDIAAKGNKVLISTGFYTDLFMPAYVHYQNTNLPGTDHPNIWGGEAAQWTEIADAGNIELRIWPRTGVIAERLWSPATVNNNDNMYERFFQLSKQLDEQGLQHINTYERGIRRLCNGNEYVELKTLTDALAPVRGYKNLFGRLSNPTRLANNSSPLVDVGDIISTDSELKRLFRKNVARYLDKKDSESEVFLRKQLQLWSANHYQLANTGMNQSRYANIAPHSANLQKLSESGLKAMDKIKAGQSFTAEEMAEYQKLITEAKKPQGDTVLDIVLEIESLINQKLVPEPKEFPLL